MKALLDLFKQVTQEEEFDAIKIGIASPEKIRSSMPSSSSSSLSRMGKYRSTTASINA